jgi:hypothetical protein
MDNNIMRKWGIDNIKPYLDKYVGNKFIYIHYLGFIVLISLGLLTNNIIYLTIGIIYLTFETYFYIVHNNYPLTVLEEQYMREYEIYVVEIENGNKKNKKEKSCKKNKKSGRDKNGKKCCNGPMTEEHVIIPPEAHAYNSSQNFYVTHLEMTTNIWIFLSCKTLGIICYRMFFG